MTTPTFGAVAERLRRSTVEILNGGSGSGVIWAENGTIVTNQHVVRSGKALVELWDGRRIPGEVKRRWPERDVAALQVDAAGLPAAEIGDSSALRAGEMVLAIGNPLGFSGAASQGIVHRVGAVAGLGTRQYVQAALRLAPGNSGGPLVNARGQVVGISTMVAGNIGLAIPSNEVSQLLRGEAQRPRLGVSIQGVRTGRGATGFLVVDIEPGSAAAEASLLQGDVLVGVNGRPFGSWGDLGDALEASGDAVRLRFLRGGADKVREVTVRLRPRAAAA